MKIAPAIYEAARNVILSEAKNPATSKIHPQFRSNNLTIRSSWVFRFAQHDNAIYWTSNHAS
jgi:hypothetical protein